MSVYCISISHCIRSYLFSRKTYYILVIVVVGFLARYIFEWFRFPFFCLLFLLFWLSTHNSSLLASYQHVWLRAVNNNSQQYDSTIWNFIVFCACLSSFSIWFFFWILYTVGIVYIIYLYKMAIDYNYTICQLNLISGSKIVLMHLMRLNIVCVCVCLYYERVGQDPTSTYKQS